LYLQVKDPGRDASWVLRFMAGKRVNQSGAHVPLVRYMGLGSARTFPLGMARERARTQRALIDDDKDPLAARDEARKAAALAAKQTITFEQCAAAFIAMKRAGWKDDEWTGSLRKHVYPVFGNVPVQDVTTQLVLAALKPIWESRTETASRPRCCRVAGRPERLVTVLVAVRARRWRTGRGRWVEGLCRRKSLCARSGV
jgi:hypothetical protein